MKVRPSVKKMCDKCKIIKRKGRVMVTPRELSVPKGKRFSTAFLNPGMICFSMVWILLIGSSLLG